MTTSFIQLLIFLLAGIALIILLTAKFRVHAFFALLLACFLVGSLLKTAQGSSTVAIITASSIILPLLSSLGLDTENGRLYVSSPWVPAQ